MYNVLFAFSTKGRNNACATCVKYWLKCCVISYEVKLRYISSASYVMTGIRSLLNNINCLVYFKQKLFVQCAPLV